MPDQWVIFTRVRLDCPTRREDFSSLEEAEEYLAAPVRRVPEEDQEYLAAGLRAVGIPRKDCDEWLDPIPVVPLSKGSAEQFTGPWLRDWLRVGADYEPAQISWSRLWERHFQDLALDRLPDEYERKRRELDIAPDSPMPPEHLKDVIEGLKQYELPEVSCALTDSWDIGRIRSTAKRRSGHIQPPKRLNFGALASVVLDLEDALRLQHKSLSRADIIHFWTALDVWEHIADFCRAAMGPEDQGYDIEPFREELMRRLGSYVFTVRSGYPGSASASDVLARDSTTNPLPEGQANQHILERSEARKAVVMPILKSKHWKRGKWATKAGVGKNSVYEYLSGKRSLSDANRKPMAQVLGLKPADLPD